MGRNLHLRSNTRRRVLKRLESLGLIVRTRVAEDERRVDVTLTSAGHTMQARLVDVPACVEDATGLTVAEMRDLQLALRRVRAILAKHTAG